MTLSERIRHRREQCGLSQSELAERLGYSDRSSIAKIESRKSDLTQSKIVAFAEALHTTPEYLMGWTDDPYDYDRDEDNIFAEIPLALFEELKNQYDGDLSDVWRAWRGIQRDAARESQPRFMTRDDLRFAFWGDDDKMSDEDVEDVLKYAEFVRQKKQAK